MIGVATHMDFDTKEIVLEARRLSCFVLELLGMLGLQKAYLDAGLLRQLPSRLSHNAVETALDDRYGVSMLAAVHVVRSNAQHGHSVAFRWQRPSHGWPKILVPECRTPRAATALSNCPNEF